MIENSCEGRKKLDIG